MTQPPLRIAIFADSVVHQLDGVGAGRGDGQGATWLPHLVEALMRDTSLELTWISLRRDLKNRNETRKGRHTFIELPQPLAKLDVLTGYRLAVRILQSEVRTIAPDVIHCWGTERAYPALLLQTNLPKLLSMNGVLGKMKKLGVLPTGWRWALQCHWEKSRLSAADLISAESAWACEAVREITPTAVTREVCYGVHPSFYNIQWNPNPSERIALFAGTVCVGKGVDLLVDAFERLSENGWICEIAGDGPLRASLEARKIPGIRWLGLLGWKALQERIQNAWCLVLPTWADSQPNVVKEARVAGLPIITTIHGGQAEYLIDGQNSVILETNNASNLAIALQRILSQDLAELRKSAAIGWVEDRQRFESAKTARSFAALYHELAGKK